VTQHSVHVHSLRTQASTRTTLTGSRPCVQDFDAAAKLANEQLPESMPNEDKLGVYVCVCVCVYVCVCVCV
jgi:hypothetical protein